MVSKVSACNWILLFDIALSHGEWIRSKNLSYRGFLTLLYSSGILGERTGVNSVLLESLWQLHGKKRNLLKGPKPLDDITVDFEGFVAVMNVVCVRCFQTHNRAELLRAQKPLAEAIFLSSEDQVELKESVVYTARRFFKPLIRRCIVTKNMVVSLDSMKNSWTPYVNQFVTHIFANSFETIIYPLFKRYSKGDRIYAEEFEKLVDEIFPSFTDKQRKSAIAVFEYKDFFGVHCLKPHFILEVPEGKERALELDTFTEALIMLGIVAFSNESVFVHHRPLTAKVWSVFEDYYCKFLDVPMIQDPVLGNKYMSIRPAISLVLPSVVPLGQVSSFLIGGWNLTVDERFGDNTAFSKDYPPCLIDMGTSRGDSSSDSCEEDDEDYGSEEEEEDEEAKLGESNHNSIEGDAAKEKNEKQLSAQALNLRKASSTPTPLSSFALASALFDKSLSHLRHLEFNSSVYCMQLCTVYVNEHRAMAIQRGPNRAEVVLPGQMWKVPTHETRVTFNECESNGRLLLTPAVTACLSLRDEHGKGIYFSRNIVLVAGTVVQTIPGSHLTELHQIFDTCAVEGCLPFEGFTTLCTALRIGTQQDLSVSFHSAQENDAQRGRSEASAGLDFSEFMVAVAMVFICQTEEKETLPNVPYLVSLALSRGVQRLPPLAGPKQSFRQLLSPQAANDKSLPHNSRIDVPYINALRQKTIPLTVHEEVEDVLKNFRKSRRSIQSLPAFPPEIREESLVLQYDDNNTLLGKVKETSNVLRDTFLKKEIVVSRQNWKAE